MLYTERQRDDQHKRSCEDYDSIYIYIYTYIHIHTHTCIHT